MSGSDPIAEARKNVTDWAERQAEAGITGSFSVNGEVSEVGRADKPALTPFPADMLPHYSEILRERDRMVAAALKASIEIPPSDLRDGYFASLKASCLQIAIDIIRKKYAERTDDGTAAENDGAGPRDDAGGAEAERAPPEAAG